MALFHHSTQVISRSAGRSSVGAAAYRLGAALVDERTGQTFNFTKKRGVDGWAILAPDNAPDWAGDPARLWNEVEQAEKRKDAQLCREVNIALPKELTAEQAKTLALDYAREQWTARGMIAMVAFHDLDSGNPHAHVMLTMREIGPEGFGKKNREWNEHSLATTYREAWAQKANEALALAGHGARIDHRTLDAQGIDRAPTQHQGPTAAAMEARGVPVDRTRVMRTPEPMGHAAALADRAREQAQGGAEPPKSPIPAGPPAGGPGGPIGRRPAAPAPPGLVSGSKGTGRKPPGAKAPRISGGRLSAAVAAAGGKPKTPEEKHALELAMVRAQQMEEALAAAERAFAEWEKQRQQALDASRRVGLAQDDHYRARSLRKRAAGEVNQWAAKHPVRAFVLALKPGDGLSRQQRELVAEQRRRKQDEGKARARAEKAKQEREEARASEAAALALAKRQASRAFHHAQDLKRQNPAAFAVLMEGATEDERRLLDPPQPKPEPAQEVPAPGLRQTQGPAYPTLRPPGLGR